MDFKDKDYSHLNGKEVIVIGEDKSKTKYKAIIVGFDYHVGVSIAMSEDQDFIYQSEEMDSCKKGEELFCANGKLSPHKTITEYDMVFGVILEMVEGGVVDFNEIEELEKEMDRLGRIRSGEMGQCAFK